VGSIKSECPSCLEVFNGTEAFEAHRVGASSKRRCLENIEMLSKGWFRGRWGRWEKPVSDPAVRPRTGRMVEA
jgi:hypothetical protein